MSLTCIDTGVSDATIEQEIPGLKSTNTEATKSIPKPDETSKLESPIEQIEVQSESDILHVASEPVVQHTASDISSTVPPNVVDRVPPADTSRKEASLPAVSNDSTSACPNLQPANNHLSSLSTDGLFKQPQLPLKLAKHNMSKSKLVIQPVITSSPALRTPHCTPMTLPPPGSKNLPAAQFPQIMTPGSILSKMSDLGVSHQVDSTQLAPLLSPLKQVHMWKVTLKEMKRNAILGMPSQTQLCLSLIPVYLHQHSICQSYMSFPKKVSPPTTFVTTITNRAAVEIEFALAGCTPWLKIASHL